MTSSKNMASSIKVKNKDIERLDTLRARLSLNGMDLNQEEIFSKLLNLGEKFVSDLNLKTESVNRKDLSLKTEYLCENCGTKVTPSMHCKQQMHLEELSGTLEWVCWMGAGCGHKVFEPCCDAASLAINDTENV